MVGSRSNLQHSCSNDTTHTKTQITKPCISPSQGRALQQSPKGSRTAAVGPHASVPCQSQQLCAGNQAKVTVLQAAVHSACAAYSLYCCMRQHRCFQRPGSCTTLQVACAKRDAPKQPTMLQRCTTCRSQTCSNCRRASTACMQFPPKVVLMCAELDLQSSLKL